MLCDPGKVGGAFPVVQSLANRLGFMCMALKSFKRLAVRAYCYSLSGAVGPCLIGSQGERRFLLFAGGGQFSSTYFGSMDDNWISGISYYGYHDSAPVVIPTVANLSVYIVTWAFVSRIDYKLPAGGYAFRGYLACPGGTQFG